MIPLRPDMTGRRFKQSGPNIPKSQRHTVPLQVRCAPELAAQARALCAARGVTLAQILKAGLDALAVPEGAGLVAHMDDDRTLKERLEYERGHADGYVAGRLATDRAVTPRHPDK